MLQEASDVLRLLHQGLEFHTPRPPNNRLAGGIPSTLGAFLDVLGESSFEKLAPRAID
jgi:hypothetical protein